MKTIMTTREKIEKKGFKVTSNIGYRNGEQTIVSYTAKNTLGREVSTATSMTALYKQL